MRRLVVASAILATLLMMPFGLAAAAPIPAPGPAVLEPDSARATAALEYLLVAQSPDGSIDGQIGQTADFVIGAAAAGYDPATLHGCAGGTGALSYLATASDAAASDAAKTGKTIVAVAAAGADPASFDGRDLMARLAALYHPASGAYGDGSTFSQSFAILAIAAADGSVPAQAIADLAALQDTDGSWSYGTAPVPAGQGDTNSTAIALMALDAAGVHSADAAALAYLHTQQLPDGGYPYQNSSVFGPPASDPDSDAIVLEALTAAGENPEAAAWSQGSNNVVSNLRADQGADGGFAYVAGSAEDAFTTSQVPAALMRKPYAAELHPEAGRAVPATLCAVPSPSVSPSPSAPASSSPTSTPTLAPTPAPTRVPTPRPTARPAAPAAATSTPTPTAPPVVSPTASAIPTATTVSTETPGALAAVAAETAAASGEPNPPAAPGAGDGGVPAPLAYVLAAVFGLVLVVGGGWLFFARPDKP